MLSIVIPAYNEEHHLKACLDSIAAQTEMPDEVILVDNNSKDDTAKIAKTYPFVRVVTEKQQGVLFARDRGFYEAKGELIGRIDADSRLARDWVEQIHLAYAAKPEAAAFTGDCYFYDFPFPAFKGVAKAVHHFMYYTMQRVISGTHILWGSNMVVTKAAWDAVEADCIRDRQDVHEDIDLSLRMHDKKLLVARWPGMKSDVSLRRGETGFIQLIHYLQPWPNTYWRCGRYVQATLIALLMALGLLAVLPLTLVMSVVRYLR